MIKLRLIVIVLLAYCAQASIRSQELSVQQKAWLYRIIEKTPALKDNWQTYLTFDTTPFEQVQQGELITNFDAIGQYQLLHPESLQFDMAAIQASSRGLIAEAAIKLTLWELNEELKTCLYRPNNCNDTLIKRFSQPLVAELPNNTKSKKQQEAILAVIHPSLPVFKKLETLEALKLDATVQRELLNRWSQLVADYVHNRSQHFFSILSDGDQIAQTAFLAAGEGSGTAGLLYEKELNPADSSQLWYGKGIGLFTYQLRTHQNTVKLKEHLSAPIQLPANQRVVLHTSLWGLNSSFKPMLIITDDTVSYHLFADFNSKSLSADAHLGVGISHLDRIDQFREKNITEPLKQLQADNSLNTIFNKELSSKEAVEEEIHQLEAEIDTLRKYEPENVNAINYRKRQINSKINILNDKERRLKELNEKLSKENKSIIKAENQLKEMISLCGPHPQSWHQQGTNYLFPTGVTFDTQTQDLILPAQKNTRELHIRLLSASYTLKGQQKDEVQAYVSLTNAVPDTEATKPPTGQLDTAFIYYFHPDAYHSYTFHRLDSSLIEQLQEYASIAFHFTPSHTEKQPSQVSYSYPNRELEYQMPMTTDALKRKAMIHLIAHDDTLHITVNASTDAVASRLSQSPDSLKQQLAISASSTGNNSYLEALRALQTLATFMETFSLAKRTKPSSISYEHPLLTPEECHILKTTIFGE